MSDTASPTEKQAPAEIMAGAMRAASASKRGMDPKLLPPLSIVAPAIGEMWREQASAGIKALAEAGYVIVPREPTDAMLENREIDRITIDAVRAIHSSELPCAAIWRAMVEAAGRSTKPPAPSPGS